MKIYYQFCDGFTEFNLYIEKLFEDCDEFLKTIKDNVFQYFNSIEIKDKSLN